MDRKPEGVSTIPSDHDQFSSQTSFAVREGERWRRMRATELESLPIGTIVMINVANGEYVTAATRLSAIDKFHDRFGRNTTLAYSFEVGRPVFVGGGIA